MRSTFTKDLYLTLEGSPQPDSDEARIKVFVKPLVMWLWIGGATMVVGTVLAAFPGRRRRLPTDPVSAPVPEPVAAPEPAEAVSGG
ncbi:MAG: hypothetical protein IPM43_05730 [Actinomycetota bacterium]|nr:MAG: hypothetical protein IPM43_05730 [Actinomycetota bacterium]